MLAAIIILSIVATLLLVLMMADAIKDERRLRARRDAYYQRIQKHERNGAS